LHAILAVMFELTSAMFIQAADYS